MIRITFKYEGFDSTECSLALKKEMKTKKKFLSLSKTAPDTSD